MNSPQFQTHGQWLERTAIERSIRIMRNTTLTGLNVRRIYRIYDSVLIVKASLPKRAISGA